MERNIGEGKVMAFASTFDNVSNDLPIHASWVPFVTQTALYLGGGGAEQPVNVPVDTYVELRSVDPNNKNGSGAAAEVLDADGKRVLVAGTIGQGHELSVRSRRIFRNQDSGRPPEPVCRSCRPTRIGPGAHPQGNAGPVERHRNRRYIGGRGRRRDRPRTTSSPGPMALHIVGIVRSSSGGIDRRGSVFAAFG